MMQLQQRASRLMRTVGLAVMLTVSTVIAFAADQTPLTYHVKIWPKLTALAEQAQQHGAIPNDAEGKPITDLKLLIKRYQGRYATPAGIYKVFEHQGQLRIKREGDLSKLLCLQEDGQFAPWRLMRGYIPVRYNETKKVRYAFLILDGREVLIVHENGIVRWAGEKVTKADIIEEWMKRAGKYTITDLPKDAPIKAAVTIRKEFDQLWLMGILISGEKIIAPLVPVTETEYRIGGLGHWAGETVQVVVENGQSVLRYGTSVLQRK